MLLHAAQRRFRALRGGFGNLRTSLGISVPVVSFNLLVLLVVGTHFDGGLTCVILLADVWLGWMALWWW